MVAAEMKEVVDLVVGGEETLCLPRRFEALHLSLASARGLMRVLRPVVETLVLPVLNAWHNLLPRRSIAGKLVGDHDARRPAWACRKVFPRPICRGIAPCGTRTNPIMGGNSIA